MDSLKDIIWGRYAINKQRLSRTQLNICVEEQVKCKEKGITKSLAEISVEKKFLDKDTVYQMLALEDLIPGYSIKKAIGTGGLGIVYLAYSHKLEKEVAIKILNPEFTDNTVVLNRFLREVEISKKLDHPHIIKGYDSGRMEDLYYLVLEYIDGQSLASFVSNSPKGMEEDQILQVALAVMEALCYAWNHGLTHRDIKPENLMFTKSGELKIGDFGLAKLAEANTALTISGTIVGTPYYISPEQVKGSINVDYRSDVYSLGATLYFLATKRVMFHGNSVIELCNAHLSMQVVPPSKYASISSQMDNLILKMVSKDPEARCKTPDELLHYLRYLLKKTNSYQKIEPSKTSRIVEKKQETKTKTSSGSANTKIEDAVIQQVLLSLNLLNMSQISECIYTQVEYQLQGIYKPLAEIISEKNYISQEYIQNLRSFRDKEGKSLFPNYEIIKELGEGGLAIVYLAKEISSNQTVALKIFAPGTSDSSSMIARFMREAEATKKLNHPNIVKAREFGMIHGIYYLAMEYVSGLSLSQIIYKMGRFEESKSLEILEQLADALTHVWQENIIHRDVKPGNILADGDTLKICDLGLAKALESELQITQEGSILGTPQFMSPEQFQPEKDLDFRTDIYSLGITFYVMLTGNLPFTVTTKIALAQAHLYHEPLPLEKYNVRVSKQTQALLNKMLSKDREKRASEKNELLEDIRRVRRGEYPKDSHFIKRNSKKVLISGIAGAAIVLIALFLALFSTSKEEPLEIFLVSPEKESKILSPEIHLQGKIKGQKISHVEVNQKRTDIIPLEKDLWEFKAHIPLVAGKNTIQIVGVSSSQKVAKEYIFFREEIEKNPPRITITEPSETEPGKTKYITQASLMIQGYAVDESGIQTILVNEQPVFLMAEENKARFQTNLSLKQGMQTITISALDKNKNRGEYTFIALYEQPKKTKKIQADPSALSLEAKASKRIKAILLEEDHIIEAQDEDWTWKAEVGECIKGLYKAPEKAGIDFITLSHKDVPQPLLIKVEIKESKEKEIRFALVRNPKGYYEKTFFHDHVMVWIPQSTPSLYPTTKNTRQGFWISKYEISNVQYNRYLETTGITTHIPPQKSSFMPDGYLHKPEYAQYPVVWVRWKDARDYCQWVRKNVQDDLLSYKENSFTVRLPSLQEILKVIGGNPNHFAWGEDHPGKNAPYRANYDANYGLQDKSSPKDGFFFTAPINHYGGEPHSDGDGQSLYGIYNLSGNASEWSWDSDPNNKKEKIIYGGSWKSRIETLKFNEIALESRPTDFQMDTIGFRIVFIEQ
ncbi:MAG: protein kinase [Candidatus Brocadiae bacterium]|nr:protein kinase [Candidatus Brocadiia bacterium]